MKEVKLFVGGYCNAPKEVAETLKFEYPELEIKKRTKYTTRTNTAPFYLKANGQAFRKNSKE